ncbi:MAG: serine/threonine protein kinase [Candidatus Eisenbacteria sp.]|nr:serine/threonine protein kinase [Candidatus Eisenbacteria bacterium]
MSSLLPSELFNDARALPPQERGVFVRGACGDNHKLAEELLRLLDVADEHPELLEEPVHEVPTQLGRFPIIRPLGKGGMGAVYLARDTALDREIAIKTLPPGSGGDLESERLKREAKTLATFRIPNIATIYSFEETDGLQFLTMEYVSGVTLAELLSRDRISVGRSINICYQIALALEEAHKHGIVHRDLKPGNVMIDSNDFVKVLDFGIAKSLGEADNRLATAAISESASSSDSSGLLGTLDYMSPEQSRIQPISPKTDLWGLGCILYECTTGLRAFRRNVQDPTLLLSQPDWSTTPPATPPKLRTLIESCLQSAPDDRPHDATIVRETLESLLEPRQKQWIAVTASALGFLAIAAAAYWGILAPKLATPADPVSAQPLPDAGLEIKYEDGSSSIIRSPSGHPQRFADAMIVDVPHTDDGSSDAVLPDRPDESERLILGWSRELATPSYLYGWNPKSEIQFVIPAMDRFPGFGTAKTGDPNSCQMRIVRVLPLPNESATKRLLVTEYTQYHPSAIRIMNLSGSDNAITQSQDFCFFHYGHINRGLFLTPGIQADRELVWLCGSTSVPRSMRDKSNMVPDNTFFLACMEIDPGTYYFPPTIEPDQDFLNATEGEAKPAEMLFYLVARGFLLEEHGFNWNDTLEYKILSVSRVRSSVEPEYHLLTSNSVVFFYRFAMPDSLVISMDVVGDANRILDARAEVQDVSSVSLIQSFLADSLYTLAYARKNFHVTGPFRDMRDEFGQLAEQ